MNALAKVFYQHQVNPPESSLLGSFALASSANALAAPNIKRRTFFSFHHGNDVKRACIVRNSWVVRPEDASRAARFVESGLWEKTKLSGDEALKRLIRAGMENTSVTCVLAGEYTWMRPWVRFEIAESIRRGNGLLAVYIDKVNCPTSGHCKRGPNPLSYMAVVREMDGTNKVYEHTPTGWVVFSRMREPVAWPRYLAPVHRGAGRLLSDGLATYAYEQGGYDELSHWIQDAAARAGR